MIAKSCQHVHSTSLVPSSRLTSVHRICRGQKKMSKCPLYSLVLVRNLIDWCSCKRNQQMIDTPAWACRTKQKQRPSSQSSGELLRFAMCSSLWFQDSIVLCLALFRDNKCDASATQTETVLASTCCICNDIRNTYGAKTFTYFCRLYPSPVRQNVFRRLRAQSQRHLARIGCPLSNCSSKYFVHMCLDYQCFKSRSNVSRSNPTWNTFLSNIRWTTNPRKNKLDKLAWVRQGERPSEAPGPKRAEWEQGWIQYSKSKSGGDSEPSRRGAEEVLNIASMCMKAPQKSHQKKHGENCSLGEILLWQK